VNASAAQRAANHLATRSTAMRTASTPPPSDPDSVPEGSSDDSDNYSEDVGLCENGHAADGGEASSQKHAPTLLPVGGLAFDPEVQDLLALSTQAERPPTAASTVTKPRRRSPTKPLALKKALLASTATIQSKTASAEAEVKSSSNAVRKRGNQPEAVSTELAAAEPLTGTAPRSPPSIDSLLPNNLSSPSVRTPTGRLAEPYVILDIGKPTRKRLTRLLRPRTTLLACRSLMSSHSAKLARLLAQTEEGTWCASVGTMLMYVKSLFGPVVDNECISSSSQEGG
jgi:hypothetical protein